MLRMIVYKVLTKDRRSAFLRPGTQYPPPGEKLEFPGIYGSLAFCSLECAENWRALTIGVPSSIWKAEAVLMPLPPGAAYVKPEFIEQLKAPREDWMHGIGHVPVAIGYWPPGTVMCSEITLLKEVEL